jgi:hypothetical protein
MKKNIIICGLIAGLIVTAFMLAAVAKLFPIQSYGGQLLLGYSSMLVAFSLIFVAVKNYREKYGNGAITFSKAFKIGLMITAIASTIYVLAWLIDYFYFIPDYYKKYSAHELASLKASGASAARIQAKIASIQHFSKLYRNPFYNAMMAYIEILPVGLIVSILAAVILKRKTNTGKVILTD